MTCIRLSNIGTRAQENPAPPRSLSGYGAAIQTGHPDETTRSIRIQRQQFCFGVTLSFRRTSPPGERSTGHEPRRTAARHTKLFPAAVSPLSPARSPALPLWVGEVLGPLGQTGPLDAKA